MTRKMRGLIRSVIALMTPPLPAASRPSKTTQILALDRFAALLPSHCRVFLPISWRRSSTASPTLSARMAAAPSTMPTGWPETLRGKAREFYERYEKFGWPQGHHLKAMVINFPGGMPGDIGFFLNWATPVK